MDVYFGVKEGIVYFKYVKGGGFCCGSEKMLNGSFERSCFGLSKILRDSRGNGCTEFDSGPVVHCGPEEYYILINFFEK
jgi:hypothetical protein